MTTSETTSGTDSHRPGHPTLADPDDDLLASYPTYAAAERTVDHLADHGFPVEHVHIIGRELFTVEDVSGRMTLPRAPASAPCPACGWVC
jgi:hypothetical protein